jgi:hypothetical protein
MKTLILALLILSGCHQYNRATLVTSNALIACDWGQTRSAAETGWSHGLREANPILGPTPSVGQVDNYMAAALVGNAILWYVLPEKIKWIVPTVVTLTQANVVRGNYYTVPRGSCGL